MVQLSNEDIKCISQFEKITGAIVKDCVITKDAIVFIVKKGEIGKAIGKKGANINKVRSVFARQILIFEDADTIEEFIQNLFGKIAVKNINIHEKMDSKIAYVKVDEKDRGAAIGRDGNRIKICRQVLLRRFNCDLRLA
jgi:N utilization substance protein A